MVVASFYGLKERREKQMYHTILIWTASFIFSGLIAGKTSFASAVNSSEGTTTSISPSSESGQEGRALEQLAVRLAAGGGAWRSSHDSKPDDDETKHPLDPTIPDMNCNVDDIAIYVSCYGPAIGRKEGAELRFTALINNCKPSCRRNVGQGQRLSQESVRCAVTPGEIKFLTLESTST
jgi:hypothetical protein